MQVTITVSGRASCAGGNIRTVEIGKSPFTIGRSDDCSLAVQDEQGAISRMHCELREDQGRLILTDHSSNGTYLDGPGNRLVRGQPTPIPAAATLLIGGATVALRAEAMGGALGDAADSPFEEELFTARPAEDPFGIGAGGATGGGAGLFGAGPADADPLFPEAPGPADWGDRHAPAGVDMHFQPTRGGRAAPSAPPADDPFGGDDPFAAAPRPKPPAAADPFGGEDPFGGADPFGGGDPFAGDDPFGDADPFAAPAEPPAPSPAPGSAAAPAPRAPGPAEAPPAAPPPPLAPAATPSADPGGLFGAGPAADPLGAAPPAPDAAQPDPFGAPPPAAAPPAPTPPAPTPPAAPAHAAQTGPTQTGTAQIGPGQTGQDPQAAAALAALFDGLGMQPPSSDPAAVAAFAAEIGRQHRAMADALRRLLLMRRDAKLAFGVRQTQVEMGMNKLKWAPDAASAVEALLGPDTGSYKRGQAAIDDAVQSLEAHQMAMIGAVRAGLKVSVAAFDPAALEGKLAAKGLSALVPQFRRAELWEKFCENYKDFAEDVDEDIRSVLGRELDRLYDGTGRS